LVEGIRPHCDFTKPLPRIPVRGYKNSLEKIFKKFEKILRHRVEKIKNSFIIEV
jgi:hypothetical protein